MPCHDGEASERPPGPPRMTDAEKKKLREDVHKAFEKVRRQESERQRQVELHDLDRMIHPGEWPALGKADDVAAPL